MFKNIPTGQDPSHACLDLYTHTGQNPLYVCLEMFKYTPTSQNPRHVYKYVYVLTHTSKSYTHMCIGIHSHICINTDLKANNNKIHIKQTTTCNGLMTTTDMHWFTGYPNKHAINSIICPCGLEKVSRNINIICTFL